MPRCYLDENVSDVLAMLLRLLGYDVVTTLELGNKGATDVVQLMTAVRSERVLVTHDRGHTELLHEAWLTLAAEWSVLPEPRHPGLLIIPDRGPLPLADAAREIDALLATTPIDGRLFSWRRPDGWREVL